MFLSNLAIVQWSLQVYRVGYSTALLQLYLVVASLEFDAESARLFLAHLSSHILVSSVADNITFPQGQERPLTTAFPSHAER